MVLPRVRSFYPRPSGVAMNGGGRPDAKVYVANSLYKNESVTTYTANGTRTTPTISMVAPDGAGNTVEHCFRAHLVRRASNAAGAPILMESTVFCGIGARISVTLEHRRKLRELDNICINKTYSCI